ncbi:MAG: hypothetical protein KME07_15540 [Pegethrix bostrychoides GSE-TBD4-15B]|jgi:hypothetical protein|uniref:Uncharacterized protein n=1 Tax=Pegethrix bostrychoides GSE-TBD4-15B TaxID=2839662 RepID=A0A951PC59_9CYAN|nr:hypothetical protein [Pegethrix bostrychoides GSE-TBD4-15B]
MSQPQFCWEQSLGCNNSYQTPSYSNPNYVNPGYIDPGYVDPGYTNPGYASSPGVPPALFLALLIGIAISALPKKKKEEPKKTPIEKMFEAIGQYESSRTDSDMRRTQFDYKFKDPCVDECPPKKKDGDKKDDKDEKKD